MDEISSPTVPVWRMTRLLIEWIFPRLTNYNPDRSLGLIKEANL